MAFGKDVTIQTHDHDKDTRTTGEVILPDEARVQRGQVLQSNIKDFLGAGLGLRADVAGGAGPHRGSAEEESGH